MCDDREQFWWTWIPRTTGEMKTVADIDGWKTETRVQYGQDTKTKRCSFHIFPYFLCSFMYINIFHVPSPCHRTIRRYRRQGQRQRETTETGRGHSVLSTNFSSLPFIEINTVTFHVPSPRHRPTGRSCTALLRPGASCTCRTPARSFPPYGPWAWHMVFRVRIEDMNRHHHRRPLKVKFVQLFVRQGLLIDWLSIRDETRSGHLIDIPKERGGKKKMARKIARQSMAKFLLSPKKEHEYYTNTGHEAGKKTSTQILSRMHTHEIWTRNK